MLKINPEFEGTSTAEILNNVDDTIRGDFAM